MPITDVSSLFDNSFILRNFIVATKWDGLVNPFCNVKLSLKTISNMTKIAEGSPIRSKTLEEKEKLLVMTNFSFHSVQMTCTAGT